ncbi:MAG: hypothetical protein WC575_01540 [Patescibacteria group bacterium]
MLEGEFNITPEIKPEIEIKEVFPSEIKEMIGKHGFDTLKVDHEFGQNWNLANLTTEDVYYLGNQFYNQRNEQAVSEQINRFYQTLIRLNSELEDIKVDSIERKLDVIRGVGSGLHFNDIKYFIEELKGDAKNQSEQDRALEFKVIEAYYRRNGIDTNKDESELNEEELRFVDKLEERVGYAFSPETAKRIINNIPYSFSNKNTDTNPRGQI